MSHFCVAVVTKNNDYKEIEKILEPYWEEKQVEPYVYTTKEDLIKNAKEYQQSLIEHFKDNPKDTASAYQQKYLDAKTDEDFYKAARTESDDHYDTDGNELCTYNPDSKWDWYSIGGRFNNTLIINKDITDCYEKGDWALCKSDEKTVTDHPELKRVNGAKIKDIHFDLMGGDYNKVLRFWELVVEGQEPQNEEDKELIKWNFYTPEYYMDQYESKEEYARQESSFSTWALVDEYGWYEQGTMGWWAMNDATKETRKSFVDAFQEYITAPEHQEEYLFIVDCHI